MTYNFSREKLWNTWILENILTGSFKTMTKFGKRNILKHMFYSSNKGFSVVLNIKEKNANFMFVFLFFSYGLLITIIVYFYLN